MNILADDNRKKELLKLEQSIGLNSGAKLYVWGCASTAKMVTEYIESASSVKVTAYIVDDLYYRDELYNNRKVIKFSQWKQIAKNGDYVVIGFTNEERAQELMDRLGEGIQGLYFYFPYSSNAYGQCLTYEKYCEFQDEFNKVYNLLEDQLSKDTMERFLDGCINGRIDALNECKAIGQYFNELTQCYQVGCFVDCGAYTGDTIEAAKSFYGDRLTKIVSFEPDEKNIQLLKERVEKCGMKEKQLCLVTMGSWSKRDTLYFSSDNSSSSISEEGDITIEVDSIDHVLEPFSEKIDYIKMDVEGSEKESLLGATNTIQKYHPILAICVYHRPEDLYELTQTIIELADGYPYKFFLRYYGPDLRELVLYALPEVNL